MTIFEQQYISFNNKIIYFFDKGIYFQPESREITNITTDDIDLTNIINSTKGDNRIEISDLTETQLKQLKLLIT